MTIEKAIHVLFENYDAVKDNPYIKKPMAYALYNTWQYADRTEKERKVNLKEAENENKA